MFAAMPQTPPSFRFGRPGPRQQQSDHRPVFSSPLSSSPVRASPLSPPPPRPQSRQQPLSPCRPALLNTFPRQIQSSPIMGGGRQSSPPSFFFSGSENDQPSQNKFRFASRNPRPNPVLKRRDEVQEGRRRLFFQNVRKRQEDKRWEMRGGEDELLKLEWLRLQRERAQAREAKVVQCFGTLDPDLAAQEEEEIRMHAAHFRQDVDALMADAVAQQEEAEIEALLETLEGQEEPSSHSPGNFSDDEEYDRLFMDLLQQQPGRQEMEHSQDVEMT
ncbi:hypothetical protein VTH06DRAFT_5164 [Thermothelomyces fergusii]